MVLGLKRFEKRCSKWCTNLHPVVLDNQVTCATVVLGQDLLKSLFHHVPTFKVTWGLALLLELLKEKPAPSIRSALSLFVISDLGLWSHTVPCKMNENDRFPGLASPSFLPFYVTLFGATLKIKGRHFAPLFNVFFFSCLGREVEGRLLFLFKQQNDWFAANGNVSFRVK